MNLYPSIQARMGSWTYYMVRMTMREVAENVRFAAEVWDDRTLDEAIQRVLDEGRVKKEIVQYLTRQEHRFFSSIVVAALEGNPHWIPLEIADIPAMQVFLGDGVLEDTFGVLRFDGRQKYYALDGQHRLAAIRTLIDKKSTEWKDAPKGFPDEEISVIIVVPSTGESPEAFLKRYRRLFGNLNRYAKSMDNVTNIIMDEDDVFAIVTRRLVTDHEFFTASSGHSLRIKTRKGKNLRPQDVFFTSLEALYAINTQLLLSRARRNGEWSNLKMYKRFRPEDDYIDNLFDELVHYWDVLLAVLPELRRDPPSMRCHDETVLDDEHDDSALFWPIGQELMAELARDLLDDGASRGITDVYERLAPLSKLSWSLHTAPWRNLVLVPRSVDSNVWKMRSEDRKPSLNIARELLWFQVGLSPLGDEALHDLHERWQGMLLPALERSEVNELWTAIMDGVVRE